MWTIYLISTGSRTYVGSTTDVHRRLRQHNGELVGGARSTAPYKGQWKLVCYLMGFENRSSACRWEKLVKSRGRGGAMRALCMWQVSQGICPERGTRPNYEVPKGLTLAIVGEVYA